MGDKENISVSVCCIVKNENRYIREWVEWYINLGFDKIFIYDNNNIDGERLDEVIGDYIGNGKVQVIDYRGKISCQCQAYNDCYSIHSQDYEWIAFFDADEFLKLNKHSNIKDYLSQEHFNDCQLIHINWLMYDDNDLLYYEDKPLNERFKRPCDLMVKSAGQWPKNNFIKSIIRKGIKDIIIKEHTISNNVICKNNHGERCDSRLSGHPYDHTDAHIKHFCNKTIEEFYWKYKRGYPNMTLDNAHKLLTFDSFFILNKRTKEKENVWKKLDSQKINLCTVHFNTPQLMDALVKSIKLHVPNFHLYIFDNSDKYPYLSSSEDITILDNTKGQIINFDEWLEQYPNRLKSTGSVNKWGSAKHCYTIQKCMEIIDDDFILMDSDILLKKDITKIIDNKYASVGDEEIFRPKIGGSNYRIVPFLCYINVNKLKENNIHYFDDKRIYGLFFNEKCETYDTGGSFHEDLININAFKKININEYIVHFRAGSWLEDARSKHNYKSLNPDVWLEKHKELWFTNETESIKKVLYTCIVGNYDKIPNVKKEEGWDYICFTDQQMSSNVWQIRPLPLDVSFLSTIRKQRYIKLNPHLFLSDYDISVWIDGSISSQGGLNEFLNMQNISDEKPIAFKIHPSRDCIYDELDACVKFKRETPENAQVLRMFYQKCNYPKHHGLYETNIVVRKHNNPKCIALMEKWAYEIMKASHRDQLSLNYCIWKLGCKDIINEFTHKTGESYFKWHPHANANYKQILSDIKAETENKALDVKEKTIPIKQEIKATPKIHILKRRPNSTIQNNIRRHKIKR